MNVALRTLTVAALLLAAASSTSARENIVGPNLSDFSPAEAALTSHQIDNKKSQAELGREGQISNEEAFKILSGAGPVPLPEIDLKVFEDIELFKDIKLPFESIELKLRLLRLRLARLVPIPGLTIDPMSRRITYEILKTNIDARAAGVYSIDMGSKYRIGSLPPMIHLALKSRGKGPSLRAEASPLEASYKVSADWAGAIMRLSAGVEHGLGNAAGVTAGLGVRLGAHQNIDYSVKIPELAGLAADHRVMWTLTLQKI